MGTINIPGYKNVFKTPDEGEGTFEVYMEGKNIDKEMFKIKANKSSILDISIFTGILNKEEFYNIVDIIKISTDKPTCIAFTPAEFESLDEDSLEEKRNEIYESYVQGYREAEIKKNPTTGKLRHFPDNITINNALIDADQIKSNYIKKDLHL